MFQSLFYWNLLSYELGRIYIRFNYEFQSLFYWNLLSYQLIGAHKSEAAQEFQSLFYWNLLSYRYQHVRYFLPCLSFNPSFTGTSSHTRIAQKIVERNIRFNPCFTGTSSHTRVSPLSEEEKVISFNPCFTGTSSHTFSRIAARFSSRLFQSLFYWNLLSYQKNQIL